MSHDMVFSFKDFFRRIAPERRLEETQEISDRRKSFDRLYRESYCIKFHSAIFVLSIYNVFNATRCCDIDLLCQWRLHHNEEGKEAHARMGRCGSLLAPQE